MIFGGDCQILFILCALLFTLQVSTSNAYYLNNNGTDVDEGCNGCVGYKCKLDDGKIKEGKDCFKNVVKLCQISKSDVLKLKNVVQDKYYEYQSETYFISSCQEKKDVNDAMKEQMNVKMDQRREKRDDEDEKSCFGRSLPAENADVSTKREYVQFIIKCMHLYLRNTIKPIEEAQSALNDVKIASKELLKIIDDANTTANEIKKFGEYFIKEVHEIAQKAENVPKTMTEVEEMLKTLNERYSMVQKKGDHIKKLGCSSEAVNCTMTAEWDVFKFATQTKNRAKENLSKAKELMKPISETKAAAEKVFAEVSVTFTAENAQELAEESKEIGESAKKLAEENQKMGYKSAAEVQKLKSSGETNGWKIGVFGISLFAFIFFD